MIAGAADHRYTAVLTELVAAAVTDPALRPHPPVDDSIRADLHTLMNHPPLNP